MAIELKNSMFIHVPKCGGRTVKQMLKKYVSNYMPLFKLDKLAVVTAAPPGWPGHHHVNCREESYWIDVFKDYGLYYDDALTGQFKTISKMNPENKGYRYGDRKNFFLRAGLVFTNGNRT